MGLDLGNARIGVAISDPERTLAFPLQNIAVNGDYFENLDEIVDLIEEYNISAVIIGLPLLLNGTMGKSAQKAHRWAQQLCIRWKNSFPAHSLDIGLVDERLTTVHSARQLRQLHRSSQEQRSIIDQQAAVEILMAVLRSFDESQPHTLQYSNAVYKYLEDCQK